MIAALVKKEFRDARPWFALAGLFLVIDVGDTLLSSLEGHHLAQTVPLLPPAAWFSWALAVLLGTGLATREADEGTLAFLDGLPLSRTRVFLVKAGVALAAVWVVPAFALLELVVIHLFVRGSLDVALRPVPLLQLGGLITLTLANGLVLGAAVGRLRSLAWLTLGLAGIALKLLTNVLPRASVLDPFGLLELRFSGTGLRLDGWHVSVQVALLLVLGAIAWRGFVTAGVQARTPVSRPVLGVVLGVSTVVALGAAFSLWVRGSTDDADDDDSEDAVPGARFVPGPPAELLTGHYRISYPAGRANEVRTLTAQADTNFLRVHELLGIPPGNRIDVDASGSAAGTLGTAFADGLRIQLDSKADAVLAHETSHVVSRRVAGDDRAWLWNEVPVLNEGLASWVQHQVVPDPAGQEEGRFALALLQVRRQLSFDLFTESADLDATHGEQLKYVAGEAVIESVEALYGRVALRPLVEAFASPRLPPELAGYPLWQAVFQLAGMDLGRIVDHLQARVERWARMNETKVSGFPRLRAGLVANEGVTGVQLHIDGELPAGAHLVLRVRPTVDGPLEQVESMRMSIGGVAWRRRDRIVGGEVCVQPGVALAGGNALFEVWSCLPVASAASWVAPADVVDQEEPSDGLADE